MTITDATPNTNQQNKKYQYPANESPKSKKKSKSNYTEKLYKEKTK